MTWLNTPCRRGCVNPDHLEPVTNEENVRRSLALRGLNEGRLAVAA